MSNERKYRMMGLVMYNLSDIQKGIQFGHAVVEYAEKYFAHPDYNQWSKNDKTFIILNGGTSNRMGYDEYSEYLTADENKFGTMEKHKLELELRGFKHAVFYEPDLNNATSAIVFLVDDRVWDKKNFPDFNFTFKPDGNQLTFVNPEEKELYMAWRNKFSTDEIETNKIIWFREWLSQFRLA